MSKNIRDMSLEEMIDTLRSGWDRESLAQLRQAADVALVISEPGMMDAIRELDVPQELLESMAWEAESVEEGWADVLNARERFPPPEHARERIEQVPEDLRGPVQSVINRRLEEAYREFEKIFELVQKEPK